MNSLLASLFAHPLGRLGADSFPFMAMLGDTRVPGNLVNGLIGSFAAAMVVIGALAVAALLTHYRGWRWLWRDWLTSVDHKKIGIMYAVLALVMLARGVIEAVLMRAQQAFGLGGGFLSPDHFAQLFSCHGSRLLVFLAFLLFMGRI